MTPALYDYLVAHAPPPDAVLQDLAAETAALGPISRMQVAVEEAAFLGWLARVIGARRAVEVGTFTGYSAIAMARGLRPDGHLLCCDVSEEWATVARRYFARAGVADRITLKIAPALETLRALPPAADVDLAFIDADKENYDLYYEQCLKLVRIGGLIAIDNALWHGAVADPACNDIDTAAIRALNRKIRDDPRVDMALLPIGDGLLLARPRG